jgi:hypothetical protein
VNSDIKILDDNLINSQCDTFERFSCRPDCTNLFQNLSTDSCTFIICYMTMGSDITARRMSIGMFYARAYSSLLKRYSIFFRFGIIDFLSLVSFISNFSRFIARNCYSPFTINIQFTLFLLLLLVLGNDVHPNPGPQDYELFIKVAS